MGRGRINVFLGSFQEAVLDFNRIIERKKDALKSLSLLASHSQYELIHSYAEAYYYRGLALGGIDKLDKAMNDFDESIKLEPDYAEPYYGKGIIKFRNKQFEAAICEFTKAVDLTPNFPVCYLLEVAVTTKSMIFLMP